MINNGVKHDGVESKLQNLLQRVLAAWERGDGRALAAEFADDGDIVFFEGSCLQGRPQIEAVMQHLFETTLRDTRYLAQVKALRFVTPEVALMQTLGGVVFPEETIIPVERCSVQTFVIVRIRGTWSVASFQNTRTRAASLGIQHRADEPRGLAHRGAFPGRAGGSPLGAGGRAQTKKDGGQMPR
jgi:uncharacterized protein (TIGR02246 family)